MSKLILSHRGCFDNVVIIENTIPAFMNNLIDGIELDVQMTKDNILVCYHDQSLQRLHNSDINITKSYYKSLVPYSIDKFESVLNTLSEEKNKSITIDCEIKVYDNDNDHDNNKYIDQICTEVKCVVNKYKNLNILVTSFNSKVIDIMKYYSIESTMIFHDPLLFDVTNFLKKYKNTKYLVLNKQLIDNKLIDITDSIFDEIHILLYTYSDKDKNIYINNKKLISYITDTPILTKSIIYAL